MLAIHIWVGYSKVYPGDQRLGFNFLGHRREFKFLCFVKAITVRFLVTLNLSDSDLTSDPNLALFSEKGTTNGMMELCLPIWLVRRLRPLGFWVSNLAISCDSLSFLYLSFSSRSKGANRKSSSTECGEELKCCATGKLRLSLIELKCWLIRSLIAFLVSPM